jgi:carbon-monoxide dehydrogenase medium subunit
VTPAPFDYRRAESREAALETLAAYGDEAVVLAGGQSLVPMLAMRLARPSVVVDITGLVDLDCMVSDGGAVRLGALLSHRFLERDPAVAQDLPLFAAAAKWVATPAIRNAGTLGGALALGDPAAEYPAVAMALDAQIRIASLAGERLIPAREFFLGAMVTAAAPGDLLLGIEVDAAAPGDGFGFAEIAERRGDYALAGAAVARRAAEGGRVRVALFAVSDTPVLAEGGSRIFGATPPASWDAELMAEVEAAVQGDLVDVALDPLRARLAGVAVARAARDLVRRQPQGRSSS